MSLLSRHVESAEPIHEIGHTPQLFLDDYLIERTSGISREVTKLDRRQAIVTNDRPWEHRVFNPTIIRSPEGFRMYYAAGTFGFLQGGSKPNGKVICVALSEAGLDFRKPALQLHPGAYGATNVVLAEANPGGNSINGAAVFFEPDREINRRYRVGYGITGGGLKTAFSADGYQFEPAAGIPVADEWTDTQQSIVWDPEIRKYIWFYRVWKKPGDGREGFSIKDGLIRGVGRMESEDFLHWTDRRVIIERQVGDPVLMDHYGLVASRRHDMMIGFLWESQWWDLGGKHGQIRGRLVVSRDHGHHWERVDGEKPFFDLGPQHAFDAGTVYPSTILTIGDEDFIYYTGTRITHAPMPRSEFPNDAYSIGVARIPRDRFVGRRAGAAEGVLVSRAFPMPPHRALFLNCSTGSNGYCRVFVESAENGSTLLAGIDFLGDSLDGEIAWQEGSPENVTGQLVRLRFQMREASLYGFRFTP